MKKRTIIIIVVSAVALALVTFGVVSARQRSLANSSDLQTYQLVTGSLSAVVDETGEVHPDQSAILYWESTGVVGEVKVGLGDRVEQDQVLAMLDEDSLPQNYYMSQQEMIAATRALEDLYENAATVSASAQAELAAARDALDDADYRWLLNQPGNRASWETLKAADAQVTITEKQMENKQKRYDNTKGKVAKAYAQIELTNAINAWQQAVWYANWLREGADEIEMGILDANVSVALARLESAEREYEKVKDGPDPEDVALAEARIAAAKAAMDTASITAPFAGVITAVEALPGDLVAPNVMGFRIDHLDTLLVDVNVSEVDIAKIDVDQPVKLEFDAILGKEYNGKVVEVSPVGIQAQGLVTFEVTIQITDADEDVRPGLTAAVQIVVSQVEDALLVANRSVRWVQGVQVVYLSQSGENATMESLVRIPVTLGASSEDFSELLAGDIEEGDYIVLNPPSVNPFENIQPGDGPPRGVENFR